MNNNSSGTLLHEIPITESISMSISQYQLCELPQVTSPGSDITSFSKHESVKLSFYLDFNMSNIITGINITYADADLAVSSFKFFDIEHDQPEETKWISLVNVQEDQQGKEPDFPVFHPNKS